MAARGPDGSVFVWRLGTSERHPIPGLLAGEFPVRWSADGRSVYTALHAEDRRTLALAKINLETGARTEWKNLVPADAVGATRIGNPMVSPDGTAYAYTYGSHISDLYLVEGLK